MRQDISRLKDIAIERAPELQPWAHYYRLRAAEMDVFLSLHDLKKVSRILEIGCGNGFASAMLSRFADKIVASDLSVMDKKSHSVGISKAAELLDRTGIGNYSVVSCSGETLPFADGSFDVVFCAHTLEHIPDRKKALHEIGRVLKDDGEAVFLLPTIMYRLFYPFSYYAGFVKKVLVRLFGKEERDEGIKGIETANEPAISPWARFRRNYPHFPLPEPHGAFDNFFVEIYNYRQSRWLHLFKTSGLEVTHTFSTMLIPRDLVSIFRDPLLFYERYSWIEKRFGSNKVFKNIGQDLCIVVKNV